MAEQQGDVVLYQTVNNGDIQVLNGITTMDGGLQTAAYLSLFGGNKDDDGRNDNPKTYWGNYLETEKAKQYRSETQYILEGFAATTSNLGKVEEAAGRDLAWMIDKKVASSVTVTASIPGLNKITLTVEIDANGEVTTIEFTENWKASE